MTVVCELAEERGACTILELWLVRHGETDWNRQGRLQGWTDIPLNASGRAQAQALAKTLRDVPVDHIYTSDLERARTTAQTLETATGAPLSVDLRLRERGFGKAEGQIRKSLDRRHVDQESDADPLAETHDAILQRVHSFLDSVAEQHANARVVAVTHGGWIRMILSSLGMSLQEPLKNAGITILSYDHLHWTIVSFNLAHHELRNRSEEPGFGQP